LKTVIAKSCNLNLWRIPQVARYLDITADELQAVASEMDSQCETLRLMSPGDPNFKDRDVLSMRRRLRRIQHRIYRRLLLPKYSVADYVHGSVPNRHIKSNAEPHLQSQFALTSDISGFYPSIHSRRVYRAFLHEFGCGPDVSRLLTRLCTYDHHLALGLVTSPLIANVIFRPVDSRIAGACQSMGLAYTRYVDDITISGKFNLTPKTCGLGQLISRIAAEHGLRINPSKHAAGRLADGHLVTKLRLRRGRMDVASEYVDDLIERMEDARRLATGGDFVGPYYSRDQLLGRINFVGWINRGRKGPLLRRFRSIDWSAVLAVARQRSLMPTKPILVNRPEATDRTLSERMRISVR